ncbi:MAG: hypothetical protein KDC44_14640 [Phaeodactylibacter sp.]|nr:hypothetical protein [Phaeodactylibacter sp.]
MYSNVRRFVFLPYAKLEEVAVKKFDQVCERLYVFVDSRVERLPLSLVRKMQKFGEKVRWISGDMKADPEMVGPISFQMGKLHAKLHPATEFVVFSDSASFDSLVKMIRKSGRQCMRLNAADWEDLAAELVAVEKPTLDSVVPFVTEQPVLLQEEEKESLAISPGTNMDEERVQETVQATFERLIRSGNRPADVETLKSYILIHHPEFSSYDGLDRVIRGLEASMDIQIREGEVHYNF